MAETEHSFSGRTLRQKRFETWFLSKFAAKLLKRSKDDGKYIFTCTNWAYEGWQGALESHERKSMTTACPECMSPNPRYSYYLKNDPANTEEIFSTENSHACTNAWHVANLPSEGTGPPNG